MMRRIFILLFFLLASRHTFLYAQKNESFGEILFRANKEYESGNFTEALRLTSSRALNKADVSDLWKTHRLNTLIYLALGQNKEARASVEKMLELNPTYQTNYVKDPADLIKLIHSITIIPKFSLGLAVSLGTNTTLPDISKSYIVADYTKKYTAGNSFLIGVSGSYNINQHLGLQFGCMVSRKSYAIDFSPVFWQIHCEERLNYLDFPLTIRYTFRPANKVHFYADGGVFAGVLLYSNSDFESTHQLSGKQFALSSIISTSRHNQYTYGLTASIGSSITIKEGILFGQISLFQTLSSITKAANRYDYNELQYNYYYLDDDISLRNISVTVGYAFFMNYKILKSK